MNYQIYFLVTSGKDSQDQAKKVTKFIVELKGKVTKEEFIGKKTLAYPIEKISEADYWQLHFSINASQIPVLRKELIQKEMVLRFLILNANEK